MHMLVFCFFFSFIKENAKTFNFRLNLGSASPRCCITDSNNNPLTVFLHSVEFFFFFLNNFTSLNVKTQLLFPYQGVLQTAQQKQTVRLRALH